MAETTKQRCALSGTAFEIDSVDLQFLERVSPRIGGQCLLIPPPTCSPVERQRRRLAYRNERHLYRRTSDLSGKAIISNYAEDAPVAVYAQDEWWSDAWEAKAYAREFDFSKTFFEQFYALQSKVPLLALSVWNSENSDFCNYVGHVRNSYLIFGSVYSEDCYYGSPYYSRDCLDTLVVRECEGCYECTDCRQLYECFYCQDCHSSNNLLYCFDLLGCSDCIGCAGLRKKQYHVFNQPYSRKAYKEFKSELSLCDSQVHQRLSRELARLTQEIPHRYMQSNQVERVSGNYVYQCKNVHDSFYADRSEDCRYCAQVVDLKDCSDLNYTEENELCYDYLGAYQNSRLVFSKFCNRVSDSLYCDSCFISSKLFGCISLRNSEYCILNRQYSEKEYQQLVPKIIEHMRETGEWGNFFPAQLSPFCYNESVAQEYFPLDENTADKRGLRWRTHSKQLPGVKKSVSPEEIPRDIADVTDEILQWGIVCEESGRPFKLIANELAFYRKNGLPVPCKHPDMRHAKRLGLRNPRCLWMRNCSKCGEEIRTTYAPERSEVVQCEKCYLGEVY